MCGLFEFKSEKVPPRFQSEQINTLLELECGPSKIQNNLLYYDILTPYSAVRPEATKSKKSDGAAQHCRFLCGCVGVSLHGLCV